jgi:hypothetical protein
MTYDNYEETAKSYKPDTLPPFIERKIYTHFEADGRISIWDRDMSNSNRILLSQMMVKVRIPKDKDLKVMMVDAIKNEIEETRANATKKINELEEKIQSLLAIEYHPNEKRSA